MLIRYPGSKDRFADYLVEFVPEGSDLSELFAGTASVTFKCLEQGRIQSYHLNDLDDGLTSLWQVVRDDVSPLIESVNEYVPNAAHFYRFKDDPGDTLLERAFRKLVLHQISYSGLGARAGSPIGGKNQTGKYAVGCRWNALLLSKKLKRCSVLLNSIPGKITVGSWEDAISPDGVLYLDPPYYSAGPSLYKYGDIDHVILSETLRVRDNWILSYDNSPEIAELYSWANVAPFPVRSSLHHKKIEDVLIISKDLDVRQ